MWLLTQAVYPTGGKRDSSSLKIRIQDISTLFSLLHHVIWSSKYIFTLAQISILAMPVNMVTSYTPQSLEEPPEDTELQHTLE